MGVLLVSIAARTVLGSAKFIHLRNALLEFLILALFVAVSFILTLPREVPLLLSAAVQRNKEVCAGITVLEGEAGSRHLLACGLSIGQPDGALYRLSDGHLENRKRCEWS
jgi:hypothetical protein